jgi:phage shock protein A
VYPLEALERMSGARDLLDAGKAATLEAAFQAAATGNDLATVPPVGVDLARQVIEGMGRLERRLSLIEAELQQDRTEANDLRRLVGYYRQELERRDAPPKPAPWWRAIWG